MYSGSQFPFQNRQLHVRFNKQLRFWVWYEFAKHLTQKFIEVFFTHNLPLYL